MSELSSDVVIMADSPIDEELRWSWFHTVVNGMFTQAELIGVEFEDASRITRLRLIMPEPDDFEGMDAHLLRFSLEEEPPIN